ncbi:MAG: hypothetical protein QQN41_02780 [Nitrosopumilus sp.]
MKKVLSYVLFGNEGRFWNGIPYILIANTATYPGFHMKFYVHKDCVNHVLFPLLSEPEKVFDNIEIEIIDEPIQGTKFTIWRMKPLWEKDIDYLFCRDLDYIVTETERKSVEYFIQSKDKITHCMRCYHLHTIPLMAGLCGFKVKDVFELIKNKASTFEKYLQFGIDELHLDVYSDTEKWVWGCDQKLLGAFFDSVLKTGNHLDCPLQSGEKARLFGCNFKPISFKHYQDIQLPKECDKEIMDFSKDMLGSLFVGQPYIPSGWHTNAIMNLACSKGFQIAEVLKKVFCDYPKIQLNLDEEKP